MTRSCEKCGRSVKPSDDAIVVVNTTLEDMKKLRYSESDVVYVYHRKCHQEISVEVIEPVDDRVEGVIEVRGKVVCSSCDKNIKRVVLTCPECFHRRTYEY